MSIWTSLATWAKAAAPSSKEILNTGLQMYTNYRNRQNALSDQQRLNLYNSPVQQMQRFKEAGLNPNLIYKQTNEGAPVRSTDAIAPKIDETVLDVLAKTNNITNKNLEQQSYKLRNENQELQNDILRAQRDDLYDKVYYQNQANLAAYDNAMEGVNLKRQERSQKDITNPLEVEKLKKQNKLIDEQIRSLSINSNFKQLTQETQKKIGEQTLKNLELVGTGINTTNGIKDFELRMRKSLEDIGIGTGVAQDIIKILLSKLLP
jgi:hypothetical protein